MAKDFTHLHVHTQYSILDGTIKIKELVKRVRELGMSACAITDHGNMHGAIEFYKACIDRGEENKEPVVKPIIGMEAYITMDPDGLDKAEMTRDNYHMVILAMNQIGFKNLIWLISNANLNNFYYKPRIYWNNLLERNEGLIITTGCLSGITGKSVRVNPSKEIEILGGVYLSDSKSFEDMFNCITPRVLALKEAFGDRLYIEIQDHDVWEQKAYNVWAQRTAWKMNIPLVITCDAHYLREKDHLAHSLIIAQQTKQTLSEYKKGEQLQYDTKCYIREAKEMYEIANAYGSPEAAENTLAIASRCNLEISLGKYQNPNFDIKACDDYKDFLRWKKEKFPHQDQ